ncbi:MAG: Sir2 family NAD-dependent protein deacetylase [Kiritimatiellia bacterium]
MIDKANSVTVLTGAGISPASGIPDFRSVGGLYSDKRNINIFDLEAFIHDPSVFYNFAREFYPKIHKASADAISQADMLLIIGTSLTVYPAAVLPNYRSEKTRLVIINRNPTPLDF